MSTLIPTAIGCATAFTLAWLGRRVIHEMPDPAQRRLARWAVGGWVLVLLIGVPGVYLLFRVRWAFLLVLTGSAAGIVATASAFAVWTRRRYPGLVKGVDAWAGVPTSDRPGTWRDRSEGA